MKIARKIIPHLWFNTNAEEAVNFYVSLFADSSVGKVARYGDTGPGPKGQVMSIGFTLNGQEFAAINGGPMFQFNEAVSFLIWCETQEEIDALVAAGIDCEVVPGVTAALAASAQVGVSLTRRALARSVTFATPSVGLDEAPSDWGASVLAADTAILYMASRDAGAIATALIARGKPAGMPVAVVRNASLPDSEVLFTTLAGLRAGLGGDGRPAVLCLGEVYREALQRACAAALQGQHSGDLLWPQAANARC